MFGHVLLTHSLETMIQNEIDNKAHIQKPQSKIRAYLLYKNKHKPSTSKCSLEPQLKNVEREMI